MYENGKGVPRDYVLAYMWYSLANAGGFDQNDELDALEKKMSEAQIAEAQRLTRERTFAQAELDDPSTPPLLSSPISSHLTLALAGSGFLVSKDGYVLTAGHIVSECGSIRTRIDGTEQELNIVGHDQVNDLAVLRLVYAPDRAAALSVQPILLGEQVVVAGFPLPLILTETLQVSDGLVSALAGPKNDSRFFGITAPIQQGNSGSPILNERGEVIGIAVTKLNALLVGLATGDIPQNVNFGLKTNVILLLLDTHGVSYETPSSTRNLSVSQIASYARDFTLRIECWQ